jgi:Uncharacterized conserved protein
MEIKTAILVDGGYYRKRAHALWGKKTAKERADELWEYCRLHLGDGAKDARRSLYRVFYYDCPPLGGNVYHPLKQANINLAKSDTFAWTENFFKELAQKRKFALRLGRLSDNGNGYRLAPDAVKKICSGALAASDLQESDFVFEIKQKGVDMKIGIDIAHLSYKKLADQIILIAGDSDFVPAAKIARREGVDFIIDPMGAHIADDLLTHVDGCFSHYKVPKIPFYEII